MTFGQACPHGNLRRQCELCDANEEIDRLRAVLTELVAVADLAARAIASADNIIRPLGPTESARERGAEATKEYMNNTLLMRLEHEKRYPLAWAAARKELEAK